MELEYTPQQPKQKEPPKSEFVLVNDVTGKAPIKRGPQVLQAYRTDNNGKKVVHQFKVPYPPKSNCKRCFGRGYIGFVMDSPDHKLAICKKCFPMM